MGNRPTGNLTLGRIEQLWPVAVLVRVVAVVILLIGPWTDDPPELSGWDVERFQEIAERTGAAWVDEPVEYPPGSVVILDSIAGPTVVETSRRLVLLSVAAELAATAALWRTLGPRAAKGFLLLGMPLVPMGLLRLDLVVTAVATAAALLLARGARSRSVAGEVRRPGVWLFGALVTFGALIKIWPGLLVIGAVARRNVAAAATAVIMCGVAGLAWLVYVGNGLEPIDQVLSLRGATGWHVESFFGSLVALFGGEEPRLELNAFRIGTLNGSLVIGGRVLAIVTIVALANAAYRPSPNEGQHSPDVGEDRPNAGRPSNNHGFDTEPLALVMLGSTAALMVTAPLLSPQFLLWLTPWGAMLLADRGAPLDGAVLRILTTLSIALLLTGSVLALFGPPNLADTAPALLLTLRNACLIALPILCIRRLLGLATPTDHASVTVE